MNFKNHMIYTLYNDKKNSFKYILKYKEILDSLKMNGKLKKFINTDKDLDNLRKYKNNFEGLFRLPERVSGKGYLNSLS